MVWSLPFLTVIDESVQRLILYYFFFNIRNSLPNLCDLDLDKFKPIRVKKKRAKCMIVKTTPDNYLVPKPSSQNDFTISKK